MTGSSVTTCKVVSHVTQKEKIKNGGHVDLVLWEDLEGAGGEGGGRGDRDEEDM